MIGNGETIERGKITRSSSVHLSCNKLDGHFDPGGSKDLPGLASVGYFSTIPCEVASKIEVAGNHVTDPSAGIRGSNSDDLPRVVRWLERIIVSVRFSSCLLLLSLL